MFTNALTLLMSFALFGVAFAEDIVAKGHGDAWQYGTGGGVVGLIVLILDIIVFLELLKSNRAPSHKLLWCLGVFFFPVLGLIAYYLFSNRDQHTAGSGEYEAIP